MQSFSQIIIGDTVLECIPSRCGTSFKVDILLHNTRKDDQWTLHWGLITQKKEWATPTEEEIAAIVMSGESETCVPGAAQTPFVVAENLNEVKVQLQLPLATVSPPSSSASGAESNRLFSDSVKGMAFVLHRAPHDWFKAQNGGNFILRAADWAAAQDSEVVERLEATLRKSMKGAVTKLLRWNFGPHVLVAAYRPIGETLEVRFASDLPDPLTLHWGISRTVGGPWEDAAEMVVRDVLRKKDNTCSRFYSAQAIHSEFELLVDEKKEPFQSLALELDGTRLSSCFEEADGFIKFVIKTAVKWLKPGKDDAFFAVKMTDEWMKQKEANRHRLLLEKKRREAAERQKARLWDRSLAAFRKSRSQRRGAFDASVSTVFSLIKHHKTVRPPSESFTFLQRMRSSSFIGSSRGQKDVGFLSFELEGGMGDLDVTLTADAANLEKGARASLVVTVIGCLREVSRLHWGLVTSKDGRRSWQTKWICPPEEIHPAGTQVVDPQRAVQSPLMAAEAINLEPLHRDMAATPMRGDLTSELSSESSEAVFSDEDDTENQRGVRLQTLKISIPGTVDVIELNDTPAEDSDCEQSARECFYFIQPDRVARSGDYPWALSLVVKVADQDVWIKQGDGRDIQVPLVPNQASNLWVGYHPELVEKIVEAEVDWSAMTLMHRYNLVNSNVTQWQAARMKSPEYSVMAGRRRRSLSKLSTYDSPNPDPLSTKRLSGTMSPSSFEDETKKDVEFWSWIAIWMRMSQLRLLDWQRNFNTKPRELAASTEAVTYVIAGVWSRFARSPIRPLARLVLSTMSRGGDRGHAIRDEILHIMHRHHIPETRGNNFYEEWHQKLHNNTTPDDVAICEAILAFLRGGGDRQAYRNTLARFSLTASRMAHYDRPIRSDPYVPACDTGKLIHDFEDYLDILKDVHDALDLQKAFDYSKPFLSNQDAVRRAIHDLNSPSLDQRFFSVTEARRILNRTLEELSARENVVACRELLFLDFALEMQQSLIVQNQSYRPSEYSHLTNEVRWILGLLDGLVAQRSYDVELRRLDRDWRAWAEDCVNYTEHSQLFGGQQREAALLLMSLIDRLSRWVGDEVISTSAIFQSKVDFMQKHVLQESHPEMQIFVEEILRSSAMFAISLMLKRVEPVVRKAAELSPWQLISVGKPEGIPCARVETIDKLINKQEVTYEEPVVLISGAVSGEEEIPEGVVAVIVRSPLEAPDILSHVAVRARNAHVILAVCYEPNVMEKVIDPLNGKYATVTVDRSKGTLTCTEIDPTVVKQTEVNKLVDKVPRKKDTDAFDSSVILDPAKISPKYVVSADEFSRAVVGAKSLNLQTLAKALGGASDRIVTPRAVALPYGTLQKALHEDSCNKELLPELKRLLGTLKNHTTNKEARKSFQKIGRLMSCISCPSSLESELKGKLAAARCQQKDFASSVEEIGLSASLCDLYNENSGNDWIALRAVWLSMFGMRPWISLRKAGLSFANLDMAVLVQELFPASMAFVLHSHNPFSAHPEETMYGELVLGLGETLVGNEPGHAMSWTLERKSGADPVLRSFPSKSQILRAKRSLIYRSDSNGEDLEGFAGAGLFESLSGAEPSRQKISYIKGGGDHLAELILTNRDARQKLLREIGLIAFLVQEKFSHTPMDIEGVVMGQASAWKIGIVQARPQV